MKLDIRPANINDLAEITFIETSCFPKEEAATEESFAHRLKTFTKSFYVGYVEDKMVCIINGCVTNSKTIFDDLYHDSTLHNDENDYQAIFGLCTLPEYQKNGLAEQIMQFFIEDSKKRGKKGVILTCKDKLISYYEKFGYKNLGVSNSVHGGAIWYDMIIEF